MPDEFGILTEEEKTKINQWLKDKWREPMICPISKDNNWMIGNGAVVPINMTKNGPKLGGNVFPQIMLICKTCGHTLFFNAVMIGIFPPTK